MFKPVFNQLNMLSILLFSFHGVSIVTCALIPDVSEAAWDGNVAYFAVPRETIAAKLEELKSQSSGCAADKLTLPVDPVLPSLIRPDQHVVAVAVGRLRDESVDDIVTVGRNDKYVTVTDTVQFFIPFLTGEDPHAVPMYKLALGSYVSTPKPFIHPAPHLPTENVESVRVTHREAYIRDGSDSFSMFYPPARKCINIDDITLAEYESYIEEFTLSFVESPDYSFCKESVFADLGLCINKIKCASCENWVHGQVNKCYVSSVRLGIVTSKFQEVGCLKGINGPSVLSMDMRGLFDVGIKTPCM